MDNYEELHRAVYHLELYCNNHGNCVNCHLKPLCNKLDKPITEALADVAEAKEKPVSVHSSR